MLKSWLLPDKDSAGSFLSHAWSLHLLKQVDLPSLLSWKQESLCERMRPGVRIWRRGIPTSSQYSALRSLLSPACQEWGSAHTRTPGLWNTLRSLRSRKPPECAGLQRNTAQAGMLCATHGLWVRAPRRGRHPKQQAQGLSRPELLKLAPGGVCLGLEERQDSSQLPTWLCGQHPEYVRGRWVRQVTEPSRPLALRAVGVWGWV